MRTDTIRMHEVPGNGVDAAAARYFRRHAAPPISLAPIFGTPVYHRSLRDYQAYGVGVLVTRLKAYGGALLADEVGLGKTRQAIIATETVAPDDRVSRLVICPAHLRDTWRAEIAVVSSMPHAWMIVSYDGASKITAPPGAVIFDELHMAKGRRTKRRQILEALTRTAHYRLGLTGTPIWSRPRDLYVIMRLLVPGIWRNALEFDIAYCAGHQGPWGWCNDGASHVDELRLRLAYYMLRRTRDEVATEIPEITRQVIWLPAEPALSAAWANGSVATGLEATLSTKIAPAVHHAIEAHPCIVWTWRRKDAEAIAEALTAEEVPAVWIHGGLSSAQRATRIQEAEYGCTLVATLDSCGTGLNLQKIGNKMIFHALDWVPVKLLQAEGRLARLGQVARTVHVVYLAVRDSADEHVVDTIVSKLDQWRQIIGTSPSEPSAALQAALSQKADFTALTNYYKALA